MDWTQRSIIKILDDVANAKLNQAVLLKELKNSIKTHWKDKKPKEWKLWVKENLNTILEKEREILQ